jgi:hypothetical protein
MSKGLKTFEFIKKITDGSNKGKVPDTKEI